jgi:tyrosyl-tRNA synthetase
MADDDVRRCSFACADTVAALERDDFAKRYAAEAPISIHEFMYPLMQAHDSVVVRADVELGGTDQTFNILLGRQLQKDAGQPPQVALILPLLEGTDGIQKMSKSLGNYIGVAEPPDEIFGKIMSISDTVMLRYYELLTNEDVRHCAPASAGGLSIRWTRRNGSVKFWSGAFTMPTRRLRYGAASKSASSVAMSMSPRSRSSSFQQRRSCHCPQCSSPPVSSTRIPMHAG